MLVAVEGLGKKMQEGGSGKKNSKRRPCSEVITSSDGLSVSGTTSANSSTPHRTETSTKHRQVLTKQAQVTSLLVSTMEALVADDGVILLGYQLRSPEADKLFWELCQIVSGNWDRMLVPAMSFASKSLALVDGNVWRQLEEGLRVARVY
jgi:hypothetical protein